jgi:hypothetical protein
MASWKYPEFADLKLLVLMSSVEGTLDVFFKVFWVFAYGIWVIRGHDVRCASGASGNTHTDVG